MQDDELFFSGWNTVSINDIGYHIGGDYSDKYFVRLNFYPISVAFDPISQLPRMIVAEGDSTQ